MSVKKKRSQDQIILNYLRRCPRKGLTSMEAFEKFKITRLSGRIKELREQGNVIDLEMKFERNLAGEPVKYGVYRLVKEAERKE